MTTVSGTSSTATTDTTAASTSGLLTDYNLFLKLLTTQMTNQDPLDPMDTSEYTQQLVQYSQVEQSIQQTGSLKDILSQLSSQQMSQASSYIGREARFDSPVSGLGDAPAHWTYYVDGTPAAMTATIKDSSGAVVNTVTLDPETQGSYSWDGTKADGSKAADGAYTFSVTATDSAGNALDTTINSVAIVNDVVTDGTNIMLGVNGIRMSASGLVAIAAAGTNIDN
ncbi:flagellar basal-body rod modification protein FlgD [Novosphingobium sp. PhB57]|jgi:flagellar basal-body rod modification protein FlgD|uniref:flagellar hook assembly protein FlgD n=1 Tax=unclassified Novosphingobium TaxID=2644732 RepID=UPI001053E0E1|nr:flagellar hook capping FlgD N-terminal domain-containing protein [Novosphingobium sp. PhB57]TCU56186.1 flagellar basal-body rod modification protein FlgD [Novosphingobium sp. PhB57]